MDAITERHGATQRHGTTTEGAAAPAARVGDELAQWVPRKLAAKPGVQAAAVLHATRLIEGADDLEARTWLREAFTRWRREGGDLLAALSLPTARRFAIAGRDLWLADAARYLQGTTWQRAHTLAGEAARFRASKWPAWQRLRAVPAGAQHVEACLFLACQAHPQLPRSTRAYHRIISDAFSQDDDTTTTRE